MTSPPPSASLPKTGREQSEFWRLPLRGTKTTRHPQGQDFLGTRTLRTTGRCRTWLQPQQRVSERGLGQGAGAQSAIWQSRINSGARWLREALLQHFNDTWAEYFAFLCIKPHSAGMRLRPLWYIIYIKIPPPASQHDFHVPPPFKIAEEYVCVRIDGRGKHLFLTFIELEVGKMPAYEGFNWCGNADPLKRRNWTPKLVQCS